MGRTDLRTTACMLVTMVTLASCASDRAGSPTLERAPGLDPRDLPIVGFVVGEYDGQDLTFRDPTREELIAAGVAIPGQDGAGEDGQTGEVGVASAPLVDIPSMACGSACTGASYVGFTNVAGSRRTVVNGMASGTDTLWTNSDLTNCGTTPTTGVCVAVRMRNMYTTQLERVYVELVSLAPTGSTTAVNTPSMPFTARADFGITADFPNAMWRYGEIARATSVAGSPSIHWAFHGSTPSGSTFTFRFLAQVRGLVSQPTRRASIAAGQTDNPGAGAYTAQTVGNSFGNSSGVSISENGRYVAFTTNSASLTGATGNFVVRKDLTTGAIALANSISCTSPVHPHLSADGSVVVFQAQSCDLAGLGSTSATNQVFVHDFSTGTTRLASISTTGGYGNTSSSNPRISADGQTVVFQSTATNLITGQPVRTACNEIYRYSRATGTLFHVSGVLGADIFDTTMGWSAACGGTTPAGETPDISGDGNIIVFASNQPLDPADALTGKDIYVYDHAATQGAGVYIVYRVSLTSGSAALSGGTGTTGVFNQPSVSGNGSFVVFSTDATNVFGPGTSTTGRRHVYRRQTAEGANSSIERVTLRVDDGEASGSSQGIATISSTGRFVAFWSSVTDLASAGSFAPSGFQVYVCDMGAPIASLTRCWVASTLQPDASVSSAFNVFSGTASSTSRIGLAYSSDIDNGFVVYQANPTADWGALNGLGTQVFISPVGDPRYQQSVTGP